MAALFTALLVLAMLAVLGSLFVGIFSMARGGDFNKKYANKLMRARVILQGSALFFFALAALAYKK